MFYLGKKEKRKTVYNKKRLRPGVGPIGKCGPVVFINRGKKVGHAQKKAVKRGFIYTVHTFALVCKVTFAFFLRVCLNKQTKKRVKNAYMTLQISANLCTCCTV